MRAILCCVLLWMPCPVWAAFPVVAATNSGEATGSVDHTINLPSGISAGHLLMAFIACRNASETWTTPSGWTLLGSTFTSGGGTSGHSRGGVYYRTADGGEGGSITLTTSGVVACAYITKRITGQHTSSAPEGGSPSSGSSVNPDPPNLAPSWGAEDTLWFTMASIMDTVTTSVYPYADGNLTVSSTVASNATIAYCEQSVNAASSDPGTYTINAAELWGAQTVAVRPAAANAFGPLRRRWAQ